MNGFAPIMELLRSDYAIIQHLALVALQRASEDGEIKLFYCSIFFSISKNVSFVSILVPFSSREYLEFCDVYFGYFLFRCYIPNMEWSMEGCLIYFTNYIGGVQ